MPIIDAHLHFIANHPDAVALIKKLDIKCLNVSVAKDAHGGWRKYANFYSQLVKDHPNNFAWCTTFDLPDFSNTNYAERIIAEMANDYANGAIAVKVWKNIGMELKRPNGRFVMIDDPIFTPILKNMQKNNRTVLMHLAEPLACWQPLDESNAHYHYYSKAPQWHMYGKNEFPSHADIIAARNRVLERYPNMRFVGAHLGSEEYDLKIMAETLDRFPNFAIDTSARNLDLGLLNRDGVRDFFTKYQDRIIFGTDIVIRNDLTTATDEELAAILDRVKEAYKSSFKFYNTNETHSLINRPVRCLDLPQNIKDKFYHLNAKKWYPLLS